MNIKNSVILITGSTSGLGSALANQFEDLGATVVLNSKNKIKNHSSKNLCLVADITDKKSVQKMTQKVIRKFGKIDIWINNAGVWSPHADILNFDSKQAHQMMEVNYFGLVYGSLAAFEQMKSQKNGIIVNIISDSALSPRPLSSAYAASKAAAAHFSSSLRLAASDFGIKVISVYPAGFKSELFNKQKPENFDSFLPVGLVAQKIIKNILQKQKVEQIIKG